jgi:hypothetical protein
VVIVARFISIEGRVDVKKAGTREWIDASQAVTLREGDLVRAGEKSKAEIQFADGTYFGIPPNSLICIAIPEPPYDEFRRPRVAPPFLEPTLDEPNIQVGPSGNGKAKHTK